MSIKNLELELKPYTTKELAAIYQVSDKTFNKWVENLRWILEKKPDACIQSNK